MGNGCVRRYISKNMGHFLLFAKSLGEPIRVEKNFLLNTHFRHIINQTYHAYKKTQTCHFLQVIFIQCFKNWTDLQAHGKNIHGVRNADNCWCTYNNRLSNPKMEGFHTQLLPIIKELLQLILGITKWYNWLSFRDNRLSLCKTFF